MSVVSYGFLVFFVLVCFVYYALPKNLQKLQWIVILAASLIFYASAGVFYLGIVTITAGIVYICSLFMQKNLDQQEQLLEGADRRSARKIKNEMKQKRKRMLTVALCAVIGILIVFKGSSFLIENINMLLWHLDHGIIPVWKLAAPLGISFYSFMMISYLMDLYHGKIHAQQNFLKYLTYVLYFPHITQGPIGRYESTGKELFVEHAFCYSVIKKGLYLMVWGYFKKLVIADRLSAFVTAVIGSAGNYEGYIFLIAGILYSIQIYCDFSGCMDIIRGASECLGITLKENFKRPYFSKTLPEFWRRWHISLGEFFRENVFYPVSTSQVFLKWNTAARKRFGNELGRNIASVMPILCVWVLTGVWHGANWNYIGWGIYHGILICLSTIFEQPLMAVNTRLKIPTEHILFKIFQMLRTFFLCVVGRLIFLGNGLSDSFHMISSMFKRTQTVYTVESFPLTVNEWCVVLICVIFLSGVSVVQEIMEKKQAEMTIRDWLDKQNVLLQMGVVLTGILVILCFGVYGQGAGAAFIYEQF